MKRSIVAAMAALLLTTSAQAGTTSTNGVNDTLLYNSKLWSVHNYTYDNGSVEQCVMSTGWTERKSVHSAWHLKFNLDTGLWWGFNKQSWRMTPGNEVMSIISVDGRTWSGKATVQSDRSTAATSFSVDHGTNFLEALRQAKKLSIVFPTAANETPFIAPVDQKALAKFEECSTRLIADGGPDEAPTEEDTQPQKPTSETPLGGPKFRGA